MPSLASPKSLSFAWPHSSISMFSGLMSLWITPFLCISSIATRTSAKIFAASRSSRYSFLFRRERRSPPAQKSETRYRQSNVWNA